MTLKIKRPAEGLPARNTVLQQGKHEGLCIHEKSLNENVTQKETKNSVKN